MGVVFMTRFVVAFLFSLLTFPAAAQVLVSGSGVSVSARDMESDLLRVPPEVRANTFSRPSEVQNNASNIFVRRGLAAEALRAGLDKNPAVSAALALARDRVLSDARLAQIDQANLPSEQSLLAYAQSVYKANTQRFEAPEQVRIRHILILVSEPGARATAEQLLKDLKTGADFEKMAKARSQDPGSAASGGDLGLVSRGRMVKPFEDAAFKLTQPGTLSDVVETNFGFHIIKLDEKRLAGLRSFEEVKDTLLKEARATLIGNARSEERDRILKSAEFDRAAIEAFAKTQSK